MRFSIVSLASAAFAAPTLYLAGDSTMADSGTGGTSAGWGKYVAASFSIPVVNNAIAGRSARSFTREGRFTAIAANVKSGDYVVIEFGHNDGYSSPDNGRSDCNPGTGSNPYAATCQVVYNGVTETTLTYEAYLVNAARLFQSKGASVIISTATPNNPYETGTFVYTANRFVGYAKDAATESGSVFIDHGQLLADTMKPLGATVVNSYYVSADHTHFSPTGAQVAEQAFIKGLKASTSTLKNYLK